MLVLLVLASVTQAPGKWPPDSLINTKVIPHNTPVTQVIGTMRNFTSMLGVRCHTCHEGEEGNAAGEDRLRKRQEADEAGGATDDADGRRRSTTGSIPSRNGPDSVVQVTCRTCHRGVSRPEPLYQVMTEAASAGGADSSIPSLSGAATEVLRRDSMTSASCLSTRRRSDWGQAGKFDDAFALLRLNEGFFPGSSGMAVFQGNIYLMKGDTTSAANAFRAAIQRDTANGEAKEAAAGYWGEALGFQVQKQVVGSG
jgi:hypothetical protein